MKERGAGMERGNPGSFRGQETGTLQQRGEHILHCDEDIPFYASGQLYLPSQEALERGHRLVNLASLLQILFLHDECSSLQ